MTRRMNAAILYGREDMRIESIPLPVPGPEEMVVRVCAALTCGTDLKVYRRGYHARMLTPPVAFGHEVAGVVHATGQGVTKFRPGDRVVPLNSAPCGNCYWCRRDQENLCDDLLFNNGAYAEYMLIPSRIAEKNTLSVPDGVALEHAALTEPLACVIRAIEESNAARGDTVTVIGAGPIGLMLLQLAKLSGLRVIAVVKHDAQVRAARLFGADEVVQTTKTADPIGAVRLLSPGNRGVDLAIDAAATVLTWQWAVDMVRKGGTVNFFGGCPSGSKVELDVNRLHYNNITLRATFHHTPASARRALDLIASGQYQCNEILTSRAPLADLNEVFQRLKNHSSDIKTVIIP